MEELNQNYYTRKVNILMLIISRNSIFGYLWSERVSNYQNVKPSSMLSKRNKGAGSPVHVKRQIKIYLFIINYIKDKTLFLFKFKFVFVLWLTLGFLNAIVVFSIPIHFRVEVSQAYALPKLKSRRRVDVN